MVGSKLIGIPAINPGMPKDQSPWGAKPAAALMLPWTDKEFAALWFRSARSSFLNPPRSPKPPAVADWLTSSRWNPAGVCPGA
jgi:hypothetical protein